MDCAIQRVNGQDKIFKCFWTWYGSRCQVHRFECVKNCNADGFFKLNSFPCVSRMVHHPKDIQKSWELWKALESIWASIPVAHFLHLVESMPWWIEAVLRANVMQFNIRKVFLMFCTLSVYANVTWGQRVLFLVKAWHKHPVFSCQDDMLIVCQKLPWPVLFSYYTKNELINKIVWPQQVNAVLESVCVSVTGDVRGEEQWLTPTGAPLLEELSGEQDQAIVGKCIREPETDKTQC
jgi:hypothetical protein